MSDVEPALTPEEWEEVLGNKDVGDIQYAALKAISSWLVTGGHGLAGICLHGQPFGFTWEMADALRMLAPADGSDRVYQRIRECDSDLEYQAVMDRYEEAAREAIDRIEALLPPRDG